MKKAKLLTVLSVPFLLLGCSNSNEKENNTPSPIETKVWTTYATSKVIKSTSRNSDFFDLGSTLKVDMMKEEYESGQIQITSGTKEKITIEYNDLTCGEKIFPKEKMSVYLQKYMKLSKNEHSTTKQFFYSGDYIPDMLLPYEIAVVANENYVDANSNQGITIDFDSYGVDAGLYTGSIKISVGEKSFTVPVELNVWDIVYEGKSSFQTLWLVYNDELFAGELDSTDEMMDTYADFLCKYKANPYVKVGQITPEEFVEDVERMWSIKNYNSCILPFSYVADYKPSKGCEEVQFIKALVRASNKNDDTGNFDNEGYYTNPNNYLKYAVSYMGAYDEADINKEANDAGVKEFFRAGGGYSQLLEMSISELTEEGFFNNKTSSVAEEIKHDIRNIPCIFTNNAGLQTDWVGELNATFCPIENLLAKTTNVERYVDGSRLSNNKYWNYTCCNPYYPYPSHHFDDDNLSMRVLGWMDRAYKCSGYLYYEANIYTHGVGEGIYVDPYDTALRTASVSGDGYLMYPGLRYGSKTPFPSTRLITYRDGLEDYDMLEIYENKLKNAAKKYGINNLDTTIYVKDLYDSLFSNAVSYEDHSLVFAARQELAKRIIALDNDAEMFYRYANDDNGSKLEVYSSYSVAYDENSKRLTPNTVSGVSNKYRFDFPLEKESKTLNISLGRDLANLKNYQINAYGFSSLFNMVSDENIVANDSSHIEFKENSIVATIVSEYKDKGTNIGSKTKNFYPFVKFQEVDITNAKYIILDYKNLTEDLALDFEVCFTNSSGVKTIIDSHYCSVGLSKTAIFNLTSSTGIKGVGSVEIRFKNYTFEGDTSVLIDDRLIEINDVALYY